jgi:hypothetical protein
MRSLRKEVGYGKEAVFTRAGIEEMSIIREWRSFLDHARKSEPMDQRILTCAHSLAAMAAKVEFMDDGSSH